MALNGSRALILLSSGLRSSSSICATCASSRQIRRFSQAAIAEKEPPAVEATSPSQSEAHRICAGVVLSRPPLITRDLHPFEKAFYLYQKRLHERLAIPFTRYLWYKKDSPALTDFQRKVKERSTPARDIGKYDAYGKEAWNDEPLVGALESEREHQMEKLLEDEKIRLPGDERKAIETKEEAEALRPRPASRVTKADQEGDTSSLDRLLQRTLYLLVETSEGKWQFPAAPMKMAEKETLHEAAERILIQSAGDRMNTWVVGNHPVGHITIPSPTATTNEQGHHLKDDMIFFMKGRIMAGHVDLKNGKLGYKGYKWLTKEEIPAFVHPRYWSWIRNMLAER